MSNVRKLFAIVLAFTLVLGMMVPAFAVANDVAGTEYESAAAKLGALGIMVGDAETGNFRPNDTIIRSEFAKIAVVALGLEDAAEAAKGATRFSDVVENHWGSGYINIAASQGIIIGDGDGNFRPDDKISYAEALTILVRVLGYGPTVEGKGVWPINFVTKAAQIGLTDDISVNAYDSAIRGVIAQLTENALTIPFLVQVGYGDNAKYVVSGTEGADLKTMLTTLKYTPAESFVIETAAVNADLDENEIILESAVNGKTKLDVADSINTQELLGKKVEFWLNKDKDVVLAEIKTADEEIVKVKEVVDITKNADGEITSIKVKDSNDKEKTYDVFTDTNAVWNLGVSSLDVLFDKIVDADGDIIKKEAYDITLTLAKDADDDDELKVKFATGLTFADPYQLTSTPVINNVSKVVRIGTIVLQSDKDTKVEKYVIVKDGEDVDIEDVEKNDVLFVAKNPGSDAGIEDDRYYIIVTSDAVVGELELVKGTMAAADKVTVDGTEYSFSAFATASDKDLVDAGIAIEDTVKLILDKDGKILEIALEDVNAADTYAVIVNAGSETDNKYGETTTYYVKLFTTEGEKVEYEAVDDAKTFLTDLAALTDAKGQLVKYHINADGEVDNIEVVAAGGTYNVDGDLDTVNGTPVKDNVVVFNLTEKATDGSDYKVEVLNWANVTDKTGANVPYMVVKDGEVEAVLFDGVTFAGDSNYAVVTAKYAIKDGYRLAMLNGGEEVSLDTVSRDVYADAGQVISYKLDAKGKVNEITVMNAEATTDDEIDDVRSNRVKIADVWYYFAEDMQVYYDEDQDGDEVTEYTKDDLYKDMKVKLYMNNDNRVAMIVITEM